MIVTFATRIAIDRFADMKLARRTPAHITRAWAISLTTSSIFWIGIAFVMTHALLPDGI